MIRIIRQAEREVLADTELRVRVQPRVDEVLGALPDGSTLVEGRSPAPQGAAARGARGIRGAGAIDAGPASLTFS